MHRRLGAIIETLEERRMLSVTVTTTNPHVWQMNSAEQFTFKNTLTDTARAQLNDGTRPKTSGLLGNDALAGSSWIKY